VADTSEHLAVALSELEAGRESLRSRIDTLDSAIAGMQAPEPSNPSQPGEQPKAIEQTEPVRENPAGIAAREGSSPASTLEQQTGLTNRVAQGSQTDRREQGRPVQRPQFKAPQERRRLGKLNVYHNQNTDWALGQFIPSHSPRAVFRHKAGEPCPHCGSQDTRISFTRGFADYFMFLFDYSNARCRSCDKRFRIWRTRPEDDAQDLEPQTSTK
jgi:hypothetical protein